MYAPIYFCTQACTGGGCTLGSASNATTEESVPHGVESPTVTAINPYSLFVQWELPQFPNGWSLFFCFFSAAKISIRDLKEITQLRKKVTAEKWRSTVSSMTNNSQNRRPH